MLGSEGLQRVDLFVEADAHDFEALRVKPLVGSHHIGDLGDARPTPRGPKVDEHHFTLHLCEIHLTTIRCGEGNVDGFSNALLSFLHPLGHGTNLSGHLVGLENLGEQLLGLFAAAQLGDFEVGRVNLSASGEFFFEH